MPEKQFRLDRPTRSRRPPATDQLKAIVKELLEEHFQRIEKLFKDESGSRTTQAPQPQDLVDGKATYLGGKWYGLGKPSNEMVVNDDTHIVLRAFLAQPKLSIEKLTEIVGLDASRVREVLRGLVGAGVSISSSSKKLDEPNYIYQVTVVDRRRTPALPPQKPADTILFLIERTYEYNGWVGEMDPIVHLVLQAFMINPAMTTPSIIATAGRFQNCGVITKNNVGWAMAKIEGFFPRALRRPESKGDGGYHVKVQYWPYEDA